jgi:ubiquinone biosynthesis protein
VAILSERYLGKQLKDINVSDLMRDLMHGAQKYGVEMPSDFVLVGKALVTLEGVGKEIDPSIDVFEEAKPLFLDILKRRYSPERIGSELLRRFEKLSGATYDLPDQLHEILDDLRLGRLTLRTTDPTAPIASDRLGRRLFSGMVASSLLLSGAWLLAARDHEGIGLMLILLGVGWLLAHAMGDALRAFRNR